MSKSENITGTANQAVSFGLNTKIHLLLHLRSQNSTFAQGEVSRLLTANQRPQIAPKSLR
jgi:hypothetical protein